VSGRRLTVVVIVVVVAAVVLGVLVLGRDEGGATAEGAVPDAASTVSAHPKASAEDRAREASPASVATADPDEYARAIAAVVFAVDTREGSSDELRAALLSEADPRLSDTGLADLTRLLRVRVPTDAEWTRMAANQQVSQWQATDVHEPGTFSQMVVEGVTDPGWAMRNVTGIQTVHYRDAGGWRESARERTVTVAMRCPLPESGVTDLDSCRLLLVPATVVP
jgi:hypothetical protein